MNDNERKRIAIEAYNSAWDLIDKSTRSSEENLRMIELAFKSKYYWSLIGNQTNFIRSDWQVARVFAEAGMLDASLFYSKKCLVETLNIDLKDFDLFFAYESCIRVYHLMSKFDLRDEYIEKAKVSISFIEKKSDKDYCQNELDKILKI